MRFSCIVPVLVGSSSGSYLHLQALPDEHWLEYIASSISDPNMPILLGQLFHSQRVATVFLAAELRTREGGPYLINVCSSVQRSVGTILDPFAEIDKSRTEFLKNQNSGKLFARTFLANMYRVCPPETYRERIAYFAHAVARFIGSKPQSLITQYEKFAPLSSLAPTSPMEYLDSVCPAHILLGIGGAHNLGPVREWIAESIEEQLKDRDLFSCTNNVCRPTERAEKFHNDQLRYISFGQALAAAILERRTIRRRLNYGLLDAIVHKYRKTLSLNDLRLDNPELYNEVISATPLPSSIPPLLSHYLWETDMTANQYILMGFESVFPPHELPIERFMDTFALNRAISGSVYMFSVEDIRESVVMILPVQSDFFFAYLGAQGDLFRATRFVEKVTGLDAVFGNIPAGGLAMLPRQIRIRSRSRELGDAFVRVSHSEDFYEVSFPIVDEQWEIDEMLTIFMDE
jgi:hypothetical protein